MFLFDLFISAAAERIHAANNRISATAHASGLMEPTSVAYDATGAEYLAPSVEAVGPFVQNEILDDENASTAEGRKPQSSPSVTEAAADYQGFDDMEETEVEEPSETPGTPASLPSLVSEPEDTCTPVKYLLEVSSAACTYRISARPAVFRCTRIFTPRCRIHRLPRNLLLALEKCRIAHFLLHLYLTRGFPDSFFNFTIYKTIKSSRCKPWFCVVVHSSKLDTRYSACLLRCVV